MLVVVITTSTAQNRAREVKMFKLMTVYLEDTKCNL